MKTAWALVLSALLVSPTWVGAAAQESASDIKAFTGSWALDKAASDDIATVMSQARPVRPGGEPGRPRGGGRGGRGGGRGPGGDAGGGMWGGGSRSEDPHDSPQAAGSGGTDSAQRKLRRQQQVARLDIFTDGNELDITDGLDMTRLLFCDGREVSIWNERGETKARAQWHDGKIIETWSGARGAARTMTYSLSADGSRLFVTEKLALPPSKDGVTMHLVYVRQEGKQPEQPGTAGQEGG